MTTPTLKQLLEQATPGEWELRRDIPYSTQGWVVFRGRFEENKTVVRLPYGCSIPPVETHGSKENEANAQLICRLKNSAAEVMEVLDSALGVIMVFELLATEAEGLPNMVKEIKQLLAKLDGVAS